MVQTIDKIVIANRSAMDAKYGAAGLAAIQAALQTLVAADKARGNGTVVFYIDDANQMAAVHGTPVVGPTDERGAKAAVETRSSPRTRPTISCSSMGRTA